MKQRVSICTPSHDPRWLKRLAESICRQTDLEFVEWLILANGPTPDASFRAEAESVCSAGVNLKIVRYAGSNLNIGALKKAAFMAADGEILLEVDHDDRLAPRAIEAVREAFDGGADYCFSNCVLFDDDDRPVGFPPSVPVRAATVYGREYAEGIAELAAHPLLLHGTWGGPMHLRAYRAEFYRLIGGHADNISITEDMELLSRAYLASEKAVHIDEPLYMFRAHLVSVFWQTRREVALWVGGIAEAVARTWAARTGLECVDGLAALHEYKGRDAGFIALGLECDASGEAFDDVLREAWSKMAPNGFVFVASKSWTPRTVAEFSSLKYGKRERLERFQSLGSSYYNDLKPRIDGNYSLEELASFHGVRACMVALKKWSRIWGENPFEPAIDEAGHVGLKPMFDAFGVTVEYKGGKAYVRGKRAAEAVAALNTHLDGCFAVGT